MSDSQSPEMFVSELVTLKELERRYVKHVLALTMGDKYKAARILGMDRRSVYRRL